DCLRSIPLTYNASNTTMTRSPEYALYSMSISSNRSRAKLISVLFKKFNSSHAPIILYPSTSNTFIRPYLKDAFYDTLHTLKDYLLQMHLVRGLHHASVHEPSSRIFPLRVDLSLFLHFLSQ